MERSREHDVTAEELANAVIDKLNARFPPTVGPEPEPVEPLVESSEQQAAK